ncbi:Histone-lysine N-methyltransferase, H3 lysine-79 specific [Venustampulla echinocandica]|uniref:Histone-lysine N-methyltransferase, H3 lysine-79 specific n=1 Tax=Venustampulla echinocandica TaxID=2656787 RepID=A0A370TW45_9HELO|nr:Histone-lysine N-methyltransferase, H3 lysine-79 specific [Venustampulla echinocandica]RDL39739.1 Histone-lysine N-methyltransferase, H3 lysine-79 specific [Venustampulla echinocandica]
MASLWGNKSKSAIKPVPAKIRIQREPVAKKPEPLPSKLASTLRHQQSPRSRDSSARASPSISRAKSCTATPPSEDYDSSSRLQPPKRKAVRQKSPSNKPIQWDDSDDDETTSGEETVNKRHKSSKRAVDLNRRLRSEKGFSEDDDGVFSMIHAADIAVSGKGSRTVAEDIIVELKYPSASSQRERYDLHFGKDKIDSTQEILDVAKIVTDVYLTKEQAEPFLDPNQGFIRQLEKAKNLLSKDTLNKELLNGFKIAVDRYNSQIETLRKDGALARNLDDRHHLPFDMVRLILRQVYDRAVSPKVDILRRYQNGSDNVYGELLPSLISSVLAETGLQSNQTFVDLGSGVGSVVLQAALEFGSESWGCEMMENACKLADAQHKEFSARCRLWGIETGEVHLERGDFLENEKIKGIMKRADVILVNNQAFTSDLNQKLIDLFLDLKDGCKIISLKSFVPHGHQITPRNISNPVNVLDVKAGRYYAKSVSWTDAGGSYFIATKDATRLRKFSERR